MKYVIDTSVAIKTFVTETDSAIAQLPTLVSAIPLLPRSLEIAKQYRQSVYDSLYAALAEREGCELVTADDKFLKAVHPAMPFVIALASLP